MYMLPAKYETPAFYRMPRHCTRSVKKILRILYFSEGIYLFKNIYFVLFKVTSLGISLRNTVAAAPLLEGSIPY